MRNIIILLLFSSFLSCHENKTPAEVNHLRGLTKNMSTEEVVKAIGPPTRKDDMGVTTDEKGDSTRVVVWYYGDNQSLSFENGKIAGIDSNVKASDARIQHIIDSAKAVDGK